MTNPHAKPLSAARLAEIRECRDVLGANLLDTGLVHPHRALADAVQEIDRLQAEAYETSPRTWCQCCVFGNHTERCTCAAATCCHPERHPGIADTHMTRLAATVDDLHERTDEIDALCRQAPDDALAAAVLAIVRRMSPAQAALLNEEN
jgi:hypothetical protein